MTQTFTSTQNEIIRYIYSETSSSENLLIQDLIATDSQSLDFYLDCLQLKEELNQISLMPNTATIDRIFEYSRNFRSAL